MSEERFSLQSHLDDAYDIYDGDERLFGFEVLDILNSAVFTREEAMAKWGLMPKPKVVVERSEVLGRDWVVKINGIVVYEWGGNYSAPLWFDETMKALGITEGGGDEY